MNLPDKLWELIDVAVKDLKSAEQDPQCIISMESWWHRPRGQDFCEICFAGAVMRVTLGIPNDQRRTPNDFHIDICNKLQALDFIRMGWIRQAVHTLYPKSTFSMWDENVPSYTKDRDGFYSRIKSIKKTLKAMDL